MEFSFTEALKFLGAAFAFTMMNEARPAQAYLLAGLLPERPMRSYHVKNASMTVRSTMAGLVGMDSPYPPTGVVDMATFLESTGKIANTATMTEEALRQLQDMLLYLQSSGASTNQQMVEEALNFTNAVIIQPHLDTAEWLRGQALALGAIDWTFNGVRLNVDYGIPSDNKLTYRTGNDAYGGSASKFWTDIRAQNRLLRGSTGIIRIIHPDLADDIVYNEANGIKVLESSDSRLVVRKMISQNGTNTESSDARDTIELIKYGLESEVLDPTDTSKTKVVSFWPKERMVAIGTGVNKGYVVGAGSRAPEEHELGYTHLAPTVEGGGSPGRWARVYVPEPRPWQLVGEGVSNLLPVIDARSAKRIVIARSAITS